MNSRLIFLLIALVGAWVLAFNSGHYLAYGLAYLISGVLGFSYLWAWNGLRRLSVRRLTRTRRSQVGQFVEEQMEITNRGIAPKSWLEVDDESTLPWHGVSRVINALGRKSTYRWQVRTLCTQRGRFRIGPITLRTGDPLGIFQMVRYMSASGYIVVYPLTVELPYFEPSISDLSGGEARHRRTYQMTTNAAGVRDYVPGDSLNRIHWPTTMRMGRLISKEFELDPTSDVWLYLDLNKSAEVAIPWTPTPPEPGLFALHSVARQKNQLQLPPIASEYLVTAAASLARYFLMRDRAVGMSSQGNTREFLQADRGERQLNKILESLAVVEAAGAMPFAQLIANDGARLNRNDTVLAISADPSPDWAVALQLLQRRGVNSIAIVVDGTTFGATPTYESVLAECEATGIPVYIMRRGDAIDSALRTPFRASRTRRARAI
jgi:uncharacterized protein (DUF58 family)